MSTTRGKITFLLFLLHLQFLIQGFYIFWFRLTFYKWSSQLIFCYHNITGFVGKLEIFIFLSDSGGMTVTNDMSNGCQGDLSLDLRFAMYNADNLAPTQTLPSQITADKRSPASSIDGQHWFPIGATWTVFFLFKLCDRSIRIQLVRVERLQF